MTREQYATQILKDAKCSLAEIKHCNGFKTACICSVLSAFDIQKESFRYAQTLDDALRIFRKNGFSAKLAAKQSKGKATKSLNRFAAPGYYLVTQRAHVLLAYVGNDGWLSFPADTDHNPLRRIECVHKITMKKNK